MRYVKNINKNGVSHFVIAFCSYIGANPYGTREIAQNRSIPCTNSCIFMHYGWGYGNGGTHERARGAGHTHIGIPQAPIIPYPSPPASIPSVPTQSPSPAFSLPSSPISPNRSQSPQNRFGRPFQRPLSLRPLPHMAQKKSEKLFENY
jgi:hypothetical protein